MGRDQRREERVSLAHQWDAQLGPVVRDDAEVLDAAADVAAGGGSPVAAVNVSAGGAAIRHDLPKPPGLHVDATVLIGLKPGPELERRWLLGEIVYMRWHDARSVVMGLRWIDCAVNVETQAILGRFVEARQTRGGERPRNAALPGPSGASRAGGGRSAIA